MVVDQPCSQHSGLFRKVGVGLHAAEGRSRGVQRGLGELEAPRVRESFRGDVEHGLDDQQEVRQVEIAPTHSASESLEDLLVVLDGLPQPRPELLIAPPLLDPYGDDLADLLGDRHPVAPAAFPAKQKPVLAAPIRECCWLRGSWPRFLACPSIGAVMDTMTASVTTSHEVLERFLAGYWTRRTRDDERFILTR
jgi:hypothetical protein